MTFERWILLIYPAIEHELGKENKKNCKCVCIPLINHYSFVVLTTAIFLIALTACNVSHWANLDHSLSLKLFCASTKTRDKVTMSIHIHQNNFWQWGIYNQKIKAINWLDAGEVIMEIEESNKNLDGVPLKRN